MDFPGWEKDYRNLYLFLEPVLLIYQIGIRMYYLIILMASPFSRRASQWISGRRANKSLISLWSTDKNRRTLWMHVSSLGEFEQGRPVIERWKAEFPEDRIMLSFYSPSGFNIRKNYPLADLVFYLPLDTPKKMNRLLDQLSPDIFILVKYDFWPNLLRALHQRKIPSYLISARFRRDQYLFKSWGSAFLRQLRVFRYIFVQDEASEKLLRSFNFSQVVVAGDTRVDAVMTQGKRAKGQEGRKEKVIIGGSTWPEEERMLANLWKSEGVMEFKEDWKLVIAPHDISEGHLTAIENVSIPLQNSRYTAAKRKSIAFNWLKSLFYY